MNHDGPQEEVNPLETLRGGVIDLNEELDLNVGRAGSAEVSIDTGTPEVGTIDIDAMGNIADIEARIVTTPVKPFTERRFNGTLEDLKRGGE